MVTAHAELAKALRTDSYSMPDIEAFASQVQDLYVQLQVLK